MADTKYEIDVTVPTGGLSAGAAAVDSLSSGLVSAGASSSQLSAALASVQARLDTAAAAVSSANDAVAAGQASYNAAEVAADRAAKAVERIGQQIAAQQGKLASALEVGDTSGAARAEAAIARLVTKQNEAASAAASAASAVTTEAAALDALKASASAAEAEEASLAATQKDLQGKLKETTAAEKKVADAARGSGAVNELGEAFGRLGGPVGAAGQKLFGAADGLKKLINAAGTGVGAMVALTVVVVALAVAMAAGAIAATAWGVKLADTARSAKLSTQALSRTSDSLKDIGSIMPSVTAKTGLQGEALTDLAKQLDGAKVSAKDMPAALEAAAIAEAALGKGGAAKLIEDLKAGKKTAGELANEMRSKFGDIVAKKMLSLDAQALKLKSNIAGTFGGLKIEGLLVGFSKLVALFDSGTASGKALKFLFEALFQPLIDGAVAAIPTIERIFLGAVLGALKLYNAMKPAVRTVRSLIEAASGGESSFDWLDVGKVALYGIAAVVGVVVVAFGALVAGITMVVAAVNLMGGIIGYAIDALFGLGAAVVGAISGIDLTSAGSAMIDGLVAGILSGVSAVVSAATAVGTAAVNAAKSVLGIASPSKVFAQLGGYTAEGFSQGVDDGAEGAEQSMAAMVAPPAAGAAGAPGKPGAQAKGEGGSPVFNFYGVTDAKQGVGMFRDAWRDFLEGGLTPSPA